ncbi:MAG: CDP-diacylglycerol--glycerol-3-phosphate 3-phosphatidyltransferase [Bacilli bacterium]
MNTANKITMSRIYLAIAMLIVLLFPWHQVGIDMPTYVLNGNMTIELKYIIAGVLFVIASLTDFIDGKVARKYNMVTDFGKMIDAISDKILTNTLIVVLACDNMVHPVIAVIIIGRDIIVDSIKMLIGNKGKAVAAIKVAKFKTASLMIGLTLKLFYDLPFSLIPIRISDFLLILAAVLAIISGAKYYVMAKEYITDK